MYDQDKTILKVIGMLESQTVGTVDVSNHLEQGRPGLMVNATQAVASLIGVEPVASMATRRHLWLRLASVALAGAVFETEEMAKASEP